jgi:hypothetical protein
MKHYRMLSSVVWNWYGCDFTVGILPIFLVHKLHMKRKTKIAVMGILSMA